MPKFKCDILSNFQTMWTSSTNHQGGIQSIIDRIHRSHKQLQMKMYIISNTFDVLINHILFLRKSHDVLYYMHVGALRMLHVA